MEVFECDEKRWVLMDDDLVLMSLIDFDTLEVDRLVGRSCQMRILHRRVLVGRFELVRVLLGLLRFGGRLGIIVIVFEVLEVATRPNFIPTPTSPTFFNTL